MTDDPQFLSETREFYDVIADDYADHFRDNLATRPMDRAMLAGFAELVQRAGITGPVADLGCGPGWLTEHLDGLGLSTFGIDLSPKMVALARREYPRLRFEEGSLLALDLADGSLAGAVSWYSTIHTPREQLPQVCAEFHRVLAPGGHLLVAFQVGDEPLHLAEPFGRPVSLDFRRRRPDQIAALLTQAGLVVRSRLVREADDEVAETAPQAYLIARKPAADAG